MDGGRADIFTTSCGDAELKFQDPARTEIQEGDLVEIIFDGSVMETYPAQSDLFAIRKLSDGSSSDIPADVLAKLDENDWYREED